MTERWKYGCHYLNMNFIIGNVAKMLGKRWLDVTIDPRPDLFLEAA